MLIRSRYDANIRLCLYLQNALNNLILSWHKCLNWKNKKVWKSYLIARNTKMTDLTDFFPLFGLWCDPWNGLKTHTASPHSQTSQSQNHPPNIHVPSCPSAETQSNILLSLNQLGVSSDAVVLLCVNSNFAPSTVTSTNRTVLKQKKSGEDIHWQISCWFGMWVWTFSQDSLEVFSSWPGLETCTLLFPHGLSLSPLSGSQQGNIVNWLYNKEKRIMHTCWYSVLFFLSRLFVCARWFEVHTELTVSFYCLHHLSSPFMEEKKMSMCRFTALCVSQFKMLQCLESYRCTYEVCDWIF